MRILIFFALLLPVLAQPPQTDAPKPQRRMPEPKNLKVLKIPASELIPLMRSFNAALGVECVHCHVQGNFAADDKPEKETGRKMIAMTEEINGKFEAGKVHVACFTCHRGQKEPVVNAPAREPAAPKPAAQ